MTPNIQFDPPDSPNPPLLPEEVRDRHPTDPEEPIPLVDAKQGGIHVPERDPGVEPTGRSKPDPNGAKELILGEGG
jgi:hypothetical protein